MNAQHVSVHTSLLETHTLARSDQIWTQTRTFMMRINLDTKHPEETSTSRQVAAAAAAARPCVRRVVAPPSAGTTYGSIKNNTSQLLEQVRSANAAAAPATRLLSSLRRSTEHMVQQILTLVNQHWFFRDLLGSVSVSTEPALDAGRHLSQGRPEDQSQGRSRS